MDTFGAPDRAERAGAGVSHARDRRGDGDRGGGRERPRRPYLRPAMPSIEDELDAVVVYPERYVARSGVGAASTMIPANMATAVNRALDRVEACQGATSIPPSSGASWG